MYYSDKPIFCCDEDALNRRYFAELMAKTLINLQNNDTFTIGLYGKWGNGKTSLVNMMIQEIEEHQNNEEIVIIRFEPWNFTSTNQLLDQFFIRLTNVFRSSKDLKLKKVGQALEKYSDAFEIAEVVPYVGKALAIFGKKGAVELAKKMKKDSSDKDILKQKENVVELLKNQEKRVLIVIDDIDRLNNEQIRQVFQLITSVAKFPNTTYLLVFDKEIVIRALEKVQEGNGEEYLEKIIQMPIQVPDIQQKEFRKVLFDRLDKIIQGFESVSFEQEHWVRMFETCVEPMVRNLRDLNRLCNSIQFKLAALTEEADFTDLLIISEIEIVYPSIYEWIKRNKSVLTGDFDYTHIHFRNKPQKEQREYFQAEITDLLKEKNEDQIKEIIDILARLFPYFGSKIGKTMEVYDVDMFRRNNRIAHPEKFDRYFNLNIEYINLRKTPILRAIHQMSQEELISFMLEMDKKDQSCEFLQEVRSLIPNISEDRAQVIIQAIFDCADKFDMVSKQSYLGIPATSYAEHLVLPLFERINEQKRFGLWEMYVNSSTHNSLPIIAQVINMMELGFGRLAANGVEREYKKVITLDELLNLEKIFVIRVKTLLENSSIFDFTDYRMILYLMEQFETEYIEMHISEELENNLCILKYLNNTISTWIGTGVRYEIRNEYEKRLSKEEILNAIKEERDSQRLFELPKDTQRLCAAFWIKEHGNVDYEGHVTQEDVDKLLQSWSGN